MLLYLWLTYNVGIEHDENKTVLLGDDTYLAFKSINSFDQLIFLIFHWADVLPDVCSVKAACFQRHQLFVALLEWLQQLLVLSHTQLYTGYLCVKFHSNRLNKAPKTRKFWSA